MANFEPDFLAEFRAEEMAAFESERVAYLRPELMASLIGIRSLGKTLQLAMAALLMALDDPDGGPILVLAPKPLLQQW